MRISLITADYYYQEFTSKRQQTPVNRSRDEVHSNMVIIVAHFKLR